MDAAHHATAAGTHNRPNYVSAAPCPELMTSCWTAYPAARCDSGTKPAAMGRATQSAVIVCQIQPNFYCRGVRLSDGASIELANRGALLSAGFVVTNPRDGTGKSGPLDLDCSLLADGPGLLTHTRTGASVSAVGSLAIRVGRGVFSD